MMKENPKKPIGKSVLANKHSCIPKVKLKANAEHKNYDQRNLYLLCSKVCFSNGREHNLYFSRTKVFNLSGRECN